MSRQRRSPSKSAPISAPEAARPAGGRPSSREAAESASATADREAIDTADREAIDTADRLHSAAIHILRRLRGEDVASGLSGPQLSALSVVVFGGPITIGELARAEQVRPPTISRLVKDLERTGLVARERDADDGRVQRLTATERGRRLLQEGRLRRVEHLARQIEELPARRRAALLDAIEVLETLARPR